MESSCKWVYNGTEEEGRRYRPQNEIMNRLGTVGENMGRLQVLEALGRDSWVCAYGAGGVRSRLCWLLLRVVI
jgi:hypothetical protein